MTKPVLHTSAVIKLIKENRFEEAYSYILLNLENDSNHIESLYFGAVASARPHVIPLAQHLTIAEVDLARAVETGAPACRQGRNRIGRVCDRAAECVFEPAVDNALRRKGLRGAKAIGFEQDRVVALVAQAIEQPKAGDAAAEYDDVCAMGRGHSGPILVVKRGWN